MSVTLHSALGAPADLILLNAAVYTVDTAQPRAQAVAVRDGHILYVGDNAGAIYQHGPQTQVINCGGRTLLPGLIDSHFHLLYGARKLDHLDLGAATNPAAIAAAVRAFAAAHPERPWIEGEQLHYSALPQAEPRLTRQQMDAWAPDRPIFLLSFDGHTAWANSEALRRGGLLNGRELPPGAAIMMDPATATATGELREPPAFLPIQNLIPKPDAARTHALLRQALALAAQHGITSVHNMDGRDHALDLYTALADAGELTLRVYCPFDINPDTPIEALAEAAVQRDRYRDRSAHGGLVRAGSVKIFLDGVLESYTALLLDDYASAPGNRGSALHTAARFNALAAAADALGLQVIAHCCGDGAVRRALDGYAWAQAANGRRDSRHRIEHIEVIHPDDVARFKQLGVIAAMQPYHCPPSIHAGDVWPDHAGAARWPLSFAWETLRRAGAHLAYGSDWPVAHMSPILGMHAALNRQPWAPGLPDQRQTLPNLIAGYTRDAAYAEFQERDKGTVRAGCLADLVVLSEDIFATPPQEFQRIQVDLTVSNGRIVHRRNL